MTYIEGSTRIVVEVDVINLVRLIVVARDDNVAQKDAGDVPLQVAFCRNLKLIVTGIRS